MVDDHISSRMVTVEAMGSLGIANVNVAKDGREAFGALTSSPVHLIVTDIYMPDIDGFQLVKAVRAHPKLNRTGVIIVTGKKDSRTIQLAKQFGVNNVLGKPFSIPELKGAIESVVGKLA